MNTSLVQEESVAVADQTEALIERFEVSRQRKFIDGSKTVLVIIVLFLIMYSSMWTGAILCFGNNLKNPTLSMIVFFPVISLLRQSEYSPQKQHALLALLCIALSILTAASLKPQGFALGIAFGCLAYAIILFGILYSLVFPPDWLRKFVGAEALTPEQQSNQ